MKKLRIAIIDDYQDVVRELDCFSKIQGHDIQIYNDVVSDLDVLAKRLADVDVLVPIRERTKIDGPLLDRLPALKLVSQNGHVPHIDLKACTDRKVLVCSALMARPSYPTVELTWGLIIGAMRHIPQESAAMRQGKWQSTIGYGLRGRTLGIYGYGKLGSMVAELGTAFGMNLLVWGRQGSLDRAKAAGLATAASKREFFQRADVLSLHLRLSPDTAGIVGPEDLAVMKPTALLVNTSRAELIQPGALASALEKGRPGMAAVDVYEQEPLRDALDPLVRLPNALCTPHLGYVERDNYEFAYGNAFDQIVAFANNEPIHVRNPEVLEKQS
jgi:D-3-phosphoglycerate dehydrogenase